MSEWLFQEDRRLERLEPGAGFKDATLDGRPPYDVVRIWSTKSRIDCRSRNFWTSNQRSHKDVDSGYTGAIHVENLEKSPIRIRLEHVFGHMTQFCRGRRLIRTIGLLRTEIKSTLQSLAYNMSRFCIISTK